ncbi:MAG: M1 family metallopeptidase [Alphaproteobacteria bacterium]|nr:M1 family metallopeptidase [Alphaproteobacteria bacterium]MCB9794455.1 M1 family metallopeptidase [Alphaproteobacteria bacterium]
MLLLLLSLAHADELRLHEATALAYEAHLTLEPRAERFEGQLSVRLALQGRRRGLRLNAEDLKLEQAWVELDGERLPVSVTPVQDQPLVELGWGRPLAGELRLVIDYSGAIDPLDSQGLFMQEEAGEAYLYTQFEPTAARRVFPCIDQPDQRAPWTLSLTVPADQRAFSNEPWAHVVSDGTQKTITFRPTPPLPSYLVAFAVGPFDVVELGRIGRGNTPARLIVPRGRAGDTGYARASTEDVLRVFEDWFDQPFPFSKLDLVSIPRPLGWAAMEHPGLITMSQSLIVSNEDEDIAHQQSWVRVLAHELAHQWFGNLVTLAWWDDIWLNESVSSWMELEAFDALHPEWEAEVRRISGRSSVMQQDALRSARRIREPITSWGDIQNAFDGITYSKGRAVLDMYEAWLGPEAFREGVLRYLQANAWGVATSDDFIEAVAGDDRELARSMRSFLDQPGVPLLRMETVCDGRGGEVRIRQERYVASGAPGRQRWSVPVVLSVGEEEARLLLTGREGRVPLQSCPASYGAGELRAPDAGPLMPNVRMKGYYRSTLEPGQAEALLGVGGALSVPEQVGLLGDIDALVTKGELEPGVLLGLLPPLLEGGQRAVIASTLGVVASLDTHLVAEDLRPAYQRFVQATYGPLAAELGLSPAEGEDARTTTLRPRLVALVGGPGADASLRAEASALALTWLETGEGLHPSMVDTALELAALGGDRALWERLRDEALTEEDRERRGALLSAMGSFRDPELIRANLELVVGGEVELGQALGLIGGALSTPESAEVTWAWLPEHLPEVEQVVPAPARAYISYFGAGFCSLEKRDEVEAFLRPHAKGWLGGGRVLDQVVEGVEVCASSVEQQRPGVRAFLEAWSEADSTQGGEP